MGISKNYSRKYRAWRSMKARCNNPRGKDAHIYYGLLCDAWQDFQQFDADVSDPLDTSLTLDRIDNNKGYQPGNVRWVPFSEQHRNQRNCKWITYNNETHLLTEWARLLGVSPSTMSQRYKRHGSVVLPRR